jgi:hypothetical protein
VLSAATEMELVSSALVRGTFKGREWILRSKPEHAVRPRGLVAQTKSLGWGMLAETAGREIVMGCATKPRESNPVFRTLSPEEFARFHKPGYVKSGHCVPIRLENAGPYFAPIHNATETVAGDRTACGDGVGQLAHRQRPALQFTSHSRSSVTKCSSQHYVN